MIGVLIDMLKKGLSLGLGLPSSLDEVFSAFWSGIQEAGF